MQVAQLIEIHLGFIPALYDLSHWTLHNCSFRAPLKPNYLNYLNNHRSDEKHFPYKVVQLLKTCILSFILAPYDLHNQSYIID